MNKLDIVQSFVGDYDRVHSDDHDVNLVYGNHEILMVYVIFDFNHMPTLKYVGGTTNYNNHCCEIFGPIPAMTTSERSWKLFTSLWCERPFLKHRIKLLALIISICVLHTTLIMLHRYEFAIETG